MMKKLNISKSEEEEFEEENKLKKSLLEESFIHKTKLSNYQHTSRFTGPAYLRKEF